jgi:hypothetical protein
VLAIQVSPLNDAPVATADEATTDEDTPVTVDVLPTIPTWTATGSR